MFWGGSFEGSADLALFDGSPDLAVFGNVVNDTDRKQVKSRKKKNRKLSEEELKRRHADDMWKVHVRWLRDEYDKAKDLTIRAYVLSCDGLLPRLSGQREYGAYVWIHSKESPLGSTSNVKDDTVLRSRTLSPEFNKCYVIAECTFPLNATLTVTVMERAHTLGGVVDTALGSTTIDIEDRWFHPTYREIVNGPKDANLYAVCTETLKRKMIL